MQIRPADPSEYAAVGDLLVESYGAIDGFTVDDALAAELRDVAGRARDALVLVADTAEGIVGTITYVPGRTARSAEFDDPDGAGIRMLAVAPETRRRGVAAALSRACLAEASRAGKSTIYLHTTRSMIAAAPLYESLGFVRDPSLDWEPEPDALLLGYRRQVDRPAPRSSPAKTWLWLR